ncbi:unnamed protein product [Closterium sp. Yama58-4]|nr:unnamed protein product [Closterium sp. Yama58-4]
MTHFVSPLSNDGGRRGDAATCRGADGNVSEIPRPADWAAVVGNLDARCEAHSHFCCDSNGGDNTGHCDDVATCTSCGEERSGAVWSGLKWRKSTLSAAAVSAKVAGFVLLVLLVCCWQLLSGPEGYMVGVNREILGGELHMVSQRGSARRELPSLTVRGSSPGSADGEDVGSGDDGSAEVPTTADETVNDMPVSTSDTLKEAETLSDEALSSDEPSSLTETLTETVSNNTFTDLDLPETVLSRFGGHSITERSTPAEPSTSNLNLPPTSPSASELASVPGSAVFEPAGLSTLTACLEVLRLAAEADPEARRLEDSGLEAEIQAWVGGRGSGDEGKAPGEAEGEDLAGRVKFATAVETGAGAEERGGTRGRAGAGAGSETGSATGSAAGSESGVQDDEETRVAYECRALIQRGLGHLAELASARDSSGVKFSAARERDTAEEGSAARKERSGDLQSEVVCSDAWETTLRARLSGDEESQKRRSQRPSQPRRLSRFHAPPDDLKAASIFSAASGGGATWPESCWPIPHVPFSSPRIFTNPRFLVLAFAMEQTSNARAHLLEAARLARLTGRVLVLPHVGSSRLSVGRQHPLCSYWDLSRLTHSSHSTPHSSSDSSQNHSSSSPPSSSPLPSHLTVEWVSPDLFLLLARSSLQPNPSVGFMCVETPSLNRPCFDFGEVASELGAILTHSLGQLPTRANTQVITVRKASRFLKAFQKWDHTDVVVWVKTTYKKMAIRPPTSVLAPVLLPYHPRWHSLATSIAAALPRTFIALHFRSEYIAWLVGGKLQQEQKIGKQMHWCVAEAARTVHQVQQQLSQGMEGTSAKGRIEAPPKAEAARTVHQVQQQLSKGMESTPAKGKNASSGYQVGLSSDGDSPSQQLSKGMEEQQQSISVH